MIVACSTDTSPTIAFDREFTLGPGQIARLAATDIALRFRDVPTDSRCPADAVCITAGDAIVVIEIGPVHANGVRYELHTNDGTPVRHGHLAISLVQLVPYPFTGRKIDADDYRATFRVTE